MCRLIRVFAGRCALAHVFQFHFSFYTDVRAASVSQPLVKWCWDGACSCASVKNLPCGEKLRTATELWGEETSKVKWKNWEIKKIPIFKMMLFEQPIIRYRKILKYSDTRKICCNPPKVQTKWLYHRVMCPKDADGTANIVDPGSTQFDQTCLSENIGPLQYIIKAICNCWNRWVLADRSVSPLCAVPSASFGLIAIWVMSWENLFMPYANSKGADQPANSHSSISAFVVHCLNSIIPPVSISKISSL